MSQMNGKGMVRPRSRSSYALRQLKSPLSNISSLGLAGLKSTGTFVILGVTQEQVTDVHPGWVPWTTNTTPGEFDEQRFQKGGLNGALVVAVEVVVVVTTSATPSTFPVTSNGFRLAWERLRSRAGLSDLRHEAISRFFELGLNIPEVAVISGHNDPRMLFRYTHLRAESLIPKLE